MRTEQKIAVITGASQGIGTDALAYAQEMSNPPQTLSGIEDSAVGLPARMLDRDARSYALIARVFASQPEGLRDDILKNVTLNWLTNTAVSSARLYWERSWPFAPKGIAIPDAVSAFPDEIYTTPGVFDRSLDGFFLTHYNFLAKLEGTTRLLPSEAAASR